ncbi:MAG TPA: M1 family metallopeptidase [Hanamia sp.]
MKIIDYKSNFLKKFLSTFITLACSSVLFAQMPTNGLDVKHYSFTIALNDSNNIIKGEAEITTGFTKDESEVIFDLVNKNNDGKGMTVTSVTKNGVTLNFSQDSQHLIINDRVQTKQVNRYTISYEGTPADGLIISNTKYGHRSFFADNWPNRAHNWIPCNDHLSDKATVDFLITAPDHYQVVSNGKLVEETNLSNHLKFTHWKEESPLPTKVMVIGVTDFAVNNFAKVDCIPVSSWVYPQDRDSGFARYAIAKNILQWYISHIGPYAFEKLANVQSKTIFGGMENASCIFYFENSVNTKDLESLMAHEIAHQWFGDNVTEQDWPHLWLSEGFATYMTDLYLKNKYGADSLKNILEEQRNEVIRFDKKHTTPVVDTTESKHLMSLLNNNSYQKGAWVLHMLRRKLGDSLFWKGIRTYYKTYYGGNANTADLEKVFEKVSGQNLKIFFNQWLLSAGLPVLNVSWNYNKIKKTLSIEIEQIQNKFFEFPLEIGLEYGSKTIIKKFDIKDKTTKKVVLLDDEPGKIIVDPNVNLLFSLQ